MPSINPYLNFSGNCQAAFDFYKSVFGGEFLNLMRWKDMPTEARQMPENANESEKIMHVALPIGKDTVLMGSDRPAMMGEIKMGDNFTISLQPDSEEEATKLFNALSAGGKVMMPLAKAFWGAYFGMLVDKFGISWMINYDYQQKQ